MLIWAQSDAGVPPWKPYLRQGWKHTRAEAIDRRTVPKGPKAKKSEASPGAPPVPKAA